MSEIAFRHPHNPDPLNSGCCVTGKVEEGVAFPTVSPEEGTIMFIGKTALIEAVAAFMDISPNQAKARMEGRPSPKQAELDAKNREIEKLKSRLARWEKFRDELEANGMIVTTFVTEA